ncbi:hypothetical protein [Streptomyces sp. 1222.5]|uniref:hypothetical protein n=1 Tax=Streptomyces sp. 1222.5 TaxID=1881026 RepID=UPI003D71D8C4
MQLGVDELGGGAEHGEADVGADLVQADEHADGLVDDGVGGDGLAQPEFRFEPGCSLVAGRYLGMRSAAAV